MQTRLMTSADIPKIKSLLERVWGTKTTIEFWQWKYFAPPFETTAFVVEADDGSIVAFTGFWIRRALILSKPFPAYQIVDVMADPDFRAGQAYGVIMHEIHNILRNQGYILYGWGNPISHSLFYKQFKDIMIINKTHLFHSLIMNAGDLINFPNFAKKCAGILNRALINAILRLRQPPTNIQVQRVNTIPNDMDHLCKKLQQQHEMSMERNAAYLQWRYLDTPHKSYQIWTARKSGRLAGYMITTIARRDSGKTKGFVLDWYTSPDSRETFNALLNGVLRWFIHKEVSVADIWALHFQRPVARTLKAYLFFKSRRNRSFLMAQRCPEASQLPSNLEKRFFTTIGDSDF